MTQTTLFEPEAPGASDATRGKFYLGKEHGTPVYAILNSAGEMRFYWRCPFCQQGVHFYSPWQKTMNGPQPTGIPQRSHIDACPHALRTIEKWMAEHWDRAAGAKKPWSSMAPHIQTEEQIRETLYCFAAGQGYRPEPFKWRKRLDGGHACNAKCISARGPSCECRCGGVNHGGIRR